MEPMKKLKNLWNHCVNAVPYAPLNYRIHVKHSQSEKIQLLIELRYVCISEEIVAKQMQKFAFNKSRKKRILWIEVAYITRL